MVFENIPIPPSSNNQYRTFMRGRKIIHVSSEELVYFRTRMTHWAIENHAGVMACRQLLGTGAVEVECLFGFHKDRLISKKGTFKRLDVSNRLKALHDSLADILGIDDSAFFAISAEKYCVETPMDESVTVRLSPIGVRSGKEGLLA